MRILKDDVRCAVFRVYGDSSGPGQCSNLSIEDTGFKCHRRTNVRAPKLGIRDCLLRWCGPLAETSPSIGRMQCERGTILHFLSF